MLTPAPEAPAPAADAATVQSTTLAQVRTQVRAHVTHGRYASGMSLSVKAVATDLHVPEDLVRPAFADLAAAGVVARNGYRYRVPPAPEERGVRARHLADRFRDEIAAGIHFPGGSLLSVDGLAGDYVTDPELVRTAFRHLESEGLLGWKRYGACRARVVLPSARQLQAAPTAQPVPRPPSSAPPTEDEIRTAISQAHSRWVSRQFQPPEAVEAAWQHMRSIAMHIVPPTVPLGTLAARPWERQAVRRVRHAAVTLLPDTSLFGMWHTAYLAVAVRTFLTYQRRRTP
ncbi:hypothetical protein ACFV2Q_20195 [Streptomyces sp. NPDC059650]|uniref:hypothetical protein n=1 Tax=Streptomyces sp. NPDC059650 TaxID=3346896 RepID=UPI0036D181DE